MIFYYIDYSLSNSIDYIIIYRETGLLICKECKFALISARIDRHFTNNSYRSNRNIRVEIQRFISYINIDNLVIEDREIRSRIDRFLEGFDSNSFIPELAIYLDGLACFSCSYVSRSRRSIQDYLKEIHNWENSRIRGRKKKSNENDPWQINVSYQQFFKSGPGSGYFRVNSNGASPIRIPERPRIEISREKDSSSSESSENEEEDSSLLGSISQGTLKYTFYYFLFFLTNYCYQVGYHRLWA